MGNTRPADLLSDTLNKGMPQKGGSFEQYDSFSYMGLFSETNEFALQEIVNQ